VICQFHLDDLSAAEIVLFSLSHSFFSTRVGLCSKPLITHLPLLFQVLCFLRSFFH
jgi:hypothetical protein